VECKLDRLSVANSLQSPRKDWRGSTPIYSVVECSFTCTQMPDPAEPVTFRFEDFLLDKQARQLFRLGPDGQMTKVQLGTRAFRISGCWLSVAAASSCARR